MKFSKFAQLLRDLANFLKERDDLHFTSMAPLDAPYWLTEAAHNLEATDNPTGHDLRNWFARCVWSLETLGEVRGTPIKDSFESLTGVANILAALSEELSKITEDSTALVTLLKRKVDLMRDKANLVARYLGR